MTYNDQMRQQLGRPGPSDAGRIAVLQAAADQFIKYGFTSTSMDGIADALGSTKGRVYHYYRSKAEIFLDVVAHGMSDLLNMIEPLACHSGWSASRKLQMMVHSHAVCMMEESHPQRVAVQLVQYRQRPEFASHQNATHQIIEYRRTYEQFFIDVLEQGVSTSEFVELDASLAAKSLLGSLNWIPMWFRQEKSSSTEVTRIADHFTTMALRSLTLKGIDNDKFPFREVLE